MIDSRTAVTDTAEFIAVQRLAANARFREHLTDFVGPSIELPTVIEVLCIDLDDTLYPQHEFLAKAWAWVANRAAELGVERDPFHRHLVWECAKGSAKGGIIDRALERTLRNTRATETDVAYLTAELVDTFRSYEPPQLTPYHGVVDALGFLQRHCALVLITDGIPSQQRAKLRASGLARYFDAAIFSDDVGRAARKPDARPFHAALRAVNADATRAVMIGDSPHKDIVGATRVGMASIRVTTGEYRLAPNESSAIPAAVVREFQHCVPLLSVGGIGLLRRSHPTAQQRDHLNGFLKASEIAKTVAPKDDIVATGGDCCARTRS